LKKFRLFEFYAKDFIKKKAIKKSKPIKKPKFRQEFYWTVTNIGLTMPGNLIKSTGLQAVSGNIINGKFLD
jgi:hypothetical protein